MSALADQIGNHPVLLALLDRLEVQRQQLGAAAPAANQHGDHRVVTQTARCLGRPASAASYATRRTAVRRRLMVAGAYPRLLKVNPVSEPRRCG